LLIVLKNLLRRTPRLKRVQIDMTPAAFARLERLKKATNSASYVEVFQDALEQREAVVKLIQEGNDIIVENQTTGKRSPLILPD
jgi:hypothetical protein